MAPFYLDKARFGYRMGTGSIQDHMVHDGLWDVVNDFHMGISNELCSERYHISRQDQDRYAERSFSLAMKSIKEGKFVDEIVPVSVPQRKGDPKIFSIDECPRETTYEQLSKMPPSGQNLGSLRPYGVTGSTAFPAEVARQLEKICGVRMLASYGATEYTQNVAQPPRDGDPRYGSAGLRLPYTQIKIVEIDDSGRIKREFATDEIGLVVVKGPSVTPGYVDDAANKGILLPDGWFNSGDLGRIDPDGFLWITGRAKDIIIRGGHNIDPTVIEETLLKHPDVVLAAAVSKPDSYAGELPIAYVQLVPNAKATADEVQAFAQANSPERAAAPKEIILIDKMPLTDVGKPAKVQLRLDAARRAFTAALADVAGGGKILVDMVADPKQGNRAVIQVDSGAGKDRQEIESRIQERMKYYATPYEIKWLEASRH
jgi:fatty-acyl-CoA synthase